MKDIHRSANDRVIAGVLGGLSQHFDWNVTIARVLFIVITIASMFTGLIAYLVLWMIMGDPE